MLADGDSFSVTLDDLDARLRQAVAHYWRTRETQGMAQGQGGIRDAGARVAVTGGKQMDGFLDLLTALMRENGVPSEAVFRGANVELPGYYRPTKEWDLVVVTGGQLLAALECKSQAGPSFGNNYNNRTEEAIGSATDLWTAHRDGAYAHGARPWIGYLMIVEDCLASRRPVKVREPHFPVFDVYRHASYIERYREMCLRLVREGLYTRAALLLSSRGDLDGAALSEPDPSLRFRPFAQSLLAEIKIRLAGL
jgi:hypothetical protein